MYLRGVERFGKAWEVKGFAVEGEGSVSC